MNRMKHQEKKNHVCELCRNEFDVIMMVRQHSFCVNCFGSGMSRMHGEFGRFREEYSSLINDD